MTLWGQYAVDIFKYTRLHNMITNEEYNLKQLATTIKWFPGYVSKSRYRVKQELMFTNDTYSLLRLNIATFLDHSCTNVQNVNKYVNVL